ncbi:MAG TPA: endopeptidase La [Ktedonobacterales bacterium]|nr:endopeptidase La [Ktedonobacterales bacterium]
MFDDAPHDDASHDVTHDPSDAPDMSDMSEISDVSDMSDAAPHDAAAERAPVSPDLPASPEQPGAHEASGINGAVGGRRRGGNPEDRVDDTVEIPETLAILPLKDHIIYPFSVSQLAVENTQAISLLEAAIEGNRLIGVVAQKVSANAAEADEATPKEAGQEIAKDSAGAGADHTDNGAESEDADDRQPGADDCYRVGVLARIARHTQAPDGGMQIVLQGLDRIVIEEFISEEPFLRARIHDAPEEIPTGLEIEVLKRNIAQLFQRVIDLVQYLPDQLAMAVSTMNDPRQLVYLIAGNLQMDLPLRQELLELNPVRAKLERLNTFLMGEVEKLEISKKIQAEAQEEMSKAQREYYLREQLKVIQKELGEESDEAATVSELREKIEEAHMSDEALKEAKRELSRLERLPSAAPEYSVIRTYIETLVALPWDKSTGKPIDIVRAREILDEDHYDLVKVKDRILEYLSVRRLKADRQGSEIGDASDAGQGKRPNREPILCFVGPPGVGKTSLGQSIAKALGREFVRMSFGGIHDEAEIRGHRRTYIGALPGRILQSLRRAGTNDPVFMLDEVDKLTADWRGDPASALLEVLDPEQNHAFRDNYLDLAFDLSKVMFIATANSLDPIPPPLRDRMEVLELAGYTEEEKLHIARRYLLPKQIKANSLTTDEVRLPDETIIAIIRTYTREAGVRGLEREIGSICRKSARRIAEGGKELGEVKPEQLRDLLGRPRHFSEVAERIDRPGVVTGLVWTPTGGDILFIEAAQAPSAKGAELVLTGQLGDVMKESATAALTYVRSIAVQLGLSQQFFTNSQIHIHVPEGGIPKDGPSAGITIMTAIVSLALDKPVRSDVAMTGEISLRGKVLPIGGLKEKVLAAHRAGIRTVIIPKRNEADLEDLPEELRAEMTFIPVDDAREALKAAIEGFPGATYPLLDVAHNTVIAPSAGSPSNSIPPTLPAPAPMPPSSSNVFPTPPLQRGQGAE